MRHTKNILTGFLFAAASVLPASAEYFTDKDLVTAGNQPGSLYRPVTAPAGNTASKSEAWEELTATAYPDNDVTFPGTGAWPDPLESQVGPNNGSSTLNKTANGFAGGPYPASAAIYYGGVFSVPNTNGGEITVEAAGSAVLAAVKTVVFQIDLGEAWTYDLYSGAAPVLTYTTSSGTGTATLAYQSLYKETFNGTVSMPSGTEDLNINSRAYQFNLSGVTGTITKIQIKFQGVQHAQLYGAAIQQFNAASSVSILP